MFVLSRQSHSTKRRVKIRCGDRIGVYCNLNSERTTNVFQFYLNQEPIMDSVTANYRKVVQLFPYVILANSLKCKVHVSSRFLKWPKYIKHIYLY